MNSPWVPKVAPSIQSPEAEIRSMSWEESQKWCNFVLMKPTLLPEGVSLETAAMRPESPPGRRDGPKDSRLPSWTSACSAVFLAPADRPISSCKANVHQYVCA